MTRLIDADALTGYVSELYEYDLCHEDADDYTEGRASAEHYILEKIREQPTIDAIPVEYLMKYAQLPTEFAIAAWRKPDKDAQEKRIKRLDKPMSLDDALNLVNDVFPLGQKEQEE